MLDNLKFIHQRDSQDALGIAEKQYQQLQHNFEMSNFEIRISKFENVVYAGMGGSALAAQVSQSWPGYGLPFEIVRQYQVPAYVRPGTLFIAASFSGNTEETLSAVHEADAAGAQIVAMASGGRLETIARDKKYPFIKLPQIVQPRYGLLYNLKAIIDVLAAAGLIDKKMIDDELAEAAAFLKQAIQPWLPTVPEAKNPAKQLALDLAGKSIAIYGGPMLSPAAYKWKINFNENAKNVAWWNELPEFDHNELTGWTAQPHDKPYGIVNLISSFEHPRVLKRFEVAEKLLSGRRPSAHKVEAQGSNPLQHLLWTLAFGDFVSIYLGLVNNVDPSPVELVEKFKKALDN